jgi:hypothetical protein
MATEAYKAEHWVEARPERLKRCAGPCGEWLPASEFYRDRSRPDGREPRCRLCESIRKRARTAAARRRRAEVTCPTR